MCEKELMIYETPRTEVIDLELEQAILDGSNLNGGINDLEEEPWS